MEMSLGNNYHEHNKRRVNLVLVTARIIFSLSALAANLLAASGTATPRPAPTDSLHRLFRSVVPYVLSASDQPAATPSLDHRAPQAFLALEALTATPFRGS